MILSTKPSTESLSVKILMSLVMAYLDQDFTPQEVEKEDLIICLMEIFQELDLRA